MKDQAELARQRAEAAEHVVSLARQLVDTDRENRSYASVLLKEAVRTLDEVEARQRQESRQ